MNYSQFKADWRMTQGWSSLNYHVRYFRFCPNLISTYRISYTSEDYKLDNCGHLNDKCFLYQTETMIRFDQKQRRQNLSISVILFVIITSCGNPISLIKPVFVHSVGWDAVESAPSRTLITLIYRKTFAKLQHTALVENKDMFCFSALWEPATHPFIQSEREKVGSTMTGSSCQDDSCPLQLSPKII